MSDEEQIEENIRKYIKEHSTTIKAYTQEYVDKKDKEIERLNNIINELEKHLEKIIIDGGTRGSMTFWYRQIYDYLQELKGEDKE